MTGHRATAADVAAAAGVSRSTVSYILNGSNRQSFSSETIARVQAVATQLAYTPHAAARALRTGISGVVLLPMPELLPGGNLAKLLSALTDGVRATGRSLVTLALRPENSLADSLRDMAPQAVLEVLPLTTRDRSAVQAISVPVVSVSTALQRLDHAAAALQVQHLAALGHRRLGMLMPDDEWVRPFRAPRVAALTRAAAELGLPAPEVASVSGMGETAIASVAQRLSRWVGASDPVTAVCCFNDLFAGVAVAAAALLGLRVPDDLSVIGIDDDPLGALLSPTLTTVRYDFTGTGQYVRDSLREALDGAQAPADPSTAALTVVVRCSTGAPQI